MRVRGRLGVKLQKPKVTTNQGGCFSLVVLPLVLGVGHSYKVVVL
jgi:hypothetical protein